MKSKKIAFSDIPELSDKQLSRMHRVGRPTVGDEPRKLIAIRLDAKVLSWEQALEQALGSGITITTILTRLVPFDIGLAWRGDRGYSLQGCFIT